MMEYYCAEREKKEVDLIYVKFSDESSFPNYLITNTFETFLEDQSLNQLFLDFDLNDFQHTSNFTTAQIQSWTKKQMLDSLNMEYFGPSGPSGYSVDKDYFYITNIEIKYTPTSYVGAFHKVGKPGGLHAKFRNSTYGETPEESGAHELGHWLGLPHTFEASNSPYATTSVVVNTTQGATRNNFMDYKIRRKKWFKFQLLNHNH